MAWVGADQRRAAEELVAGRPVVLVLPPNMTVPPAVAAAASEGKGGRLAVFVDRSAPADEPPDAALELAKELFER